jgi:hypothetical protein
MKPAGWILLGTVAFVAFAVWSESVAANTVTPAAAAWPAQSAPATQAAPPIAIVSGTWGANCGAPHGNATRDLALRCNGLRTCGYVLAGTPASTRGTSSGACHVDYRARWRCGSHEFHDAALSAGASAGDTLVLSCVPESGPGH